jgi:hypothetical protein
MFQDGVEAIRMLTSRQTPGLEGRESGTAGAESAVGIRLAARRQVERIRRTLAARPVVTLALLAIITLGVYVEQMGMSERLRTTWHLVNHWDLAIAATMPGAGFFRAAVAWLPTRAPAALLAGAPPSAGPFLMADYGFVAVTSLTFVPYFVALWWLGRHPIPAAMRARALWVIVGAGAAFGALLLFSPSAPSHDPIAYGSYGRLMAVYHANPFLAVPGDYPRDPLLAANEWPRAATAYGPLWNILSFLLAPVVGDDPLRSNMVFRVVAYAFHLANIGILVAAFRALPERFAAWRARGLLIYAWNPLVVVEVAAGHNDVAMLTLILLGLYLLARGRMVLAMLGLAGALLIKSSAWPLVLVILLGVWLAGVGGGGVARRDARRHAWVRPLRAAAVVAGTVVLGYLPFVWGHSPSDLSAASKAQPTEQALSLHVASSFATLAGALTGSGALPAPLAADLARGLLVLSNPTLWTATVSLALVVACYFVLPLARRSATLPSALAWVYTVFLVFLSIFHLLRTWYVVPLVGLVALAPGGRAIRRFTLLLTATTQIENLFLSKAPPFDGWQPWTWLLVMGIPLVVLAVDLRREGFSWRRATARGRDVLLAGLAALPGRLGAAVAALPLGGRR